jgi:hypothetical protein
METTSLASTTHTPTSMIIVDMGKKKQKQIKQLRKGKGKLLSEVKENLADLKIAGTISESAQPVIFIIVEENAPSGLLPPLF